METGQVAQRRSKLAYHWRQRQHCCRSSANMLHSSCTATGAWTFQGTVPEQAITDEDEEVRGHGDDGS